MRVFLLVATLLGMAFIAEASRFDTFFSSERQNRQLFVTPPSKIRKTSDESPTSRTSRGDNPRISTVFLSSSSAASTESNPTINYIPLSQATSGTATTPEDENSPSTGGSSTTKFYPSTASQFSTTQDQLSSRATSKLPPSENNRATPSPASKTRSTAYQTEGETLQDRKSESQDQDSFTIRRKTATIKRTKAPPPMTTPLPSTSPQTRASQSNFPSTYSIAATQPSVPAPSSNKGQNSNEGIEVDATGDQSKNGTDGVEQRSALIRMPSRDAQVIFLADDPEAAAKIPGLLTQLQEHSRNHPTAQIFPHSRRVPSTQPGSIRYSPDERITIADTEYTLMDLHTTLDDMHTSGGAVGGRTRAMDDSTETTIIVEGRDSGDHGTSRHHPGFPSRGGPSSFDYRSPFGQAGGGSPVISKEAAAFSSFPHSTFLRSRPGSTLSRPVVNMTRVTHIEAECQDDYMRIHTQFNGTFGGLIYSAGYAYDRDCIYINGTGRNLYDFHIQLNRCGTLGGNEKGELDIRGRPTQKNMMWNTLTVQYNPLIEEEWDEHFKVTCEYGYDFWKTVTFPFLDVEVQTGNPVVFTLTPPECHMEIRYGYGTSGQRITGPVRVGDPLTLVIYMRSELDGFDIVVSDCFAHNGGNKRISLIDHYGCPVDEKLISHFEGTKSDDGHFETQVYAFMKTFRFTGSPALYIECDVRMCHGECPPQPCHWKRTTRERRSLPDATQAPPSGNVSESLNLFQSLQVLRDEDPLPRAPSLEGAVEGSICLKNGTFSAAAGAVTALLGLLTAACVVMCLRSRRMKKEEKGTSPKPTIVPTYKSDFVPPSKRRLE